MVNVREPTNAKVVDRARNMICTSRYWRGTEEIKSYFLIGCSVKSPVQINTHILGATERRHWPQVLLPNYIWISHVKKSKYQSVRVPESASSEVRAFNVHSWMAVH